MYRALEVAAVPGSPYSVAWMSAGWRGEADRQWYTLDFASQQERARFLLWAENQPGAGPEDADDFRAQWDMVSGFDARELRAIVNTFHTQGASAAIRALRLIEPDNARDTLRRFYAVRRFYV